MVSKLKVKKGTEWLKPQNGPIIISGPCSAESEEQVLNTTIELAESGKVSILRAGIWKPRTRPNAFEGIGAEALKWLVKAGKETNLPTCTEVATALHVEQALKESVDILWVGARTATNPFSVQEIADAVKGTKTPILVKNPINPDLNLWIGALERFNNAGIEKLGAIHRGFSTFHQQYRNAPLWEIPLQLKTLFPDITLINDPSHISGTREHLLAVSQKAMDLNMDGLMIESHINPEVALSDSKQQVTPSDLINLLNQLHFRSSKSDSESYNTRLEELRSEIDRIDLELFSQIAKRLDITKEIGKYKKENDVTPFQLNRWKEIIETRQPFAISKGLSSNFTDRILQLLHDESIKIQSDILNSEEKQ